MVNDQIRRNDESGGVASLFVAMIELGDATTKFTMNQLQNAVDMFVDPGRAIDRTRRSLNNFSVAMYKSAHGDYDRHEMDTQKDLSGQRHTEGQQENWNEDEGRHRRATGLQNGTHSRQDYDENENGGEHPRASSHQTASHSHQQDHKKHSTGHAEEPSKSSK